MINGKLLASPINWLTVWLMLVIAAFAGHYFLRAAGFENPNDSGN